MNARPSWCQRSVYHFNLVQMGLEIFLDLMHLTHPVSGCRIGGGDRYGQEQMGVEVTVCIKQTLPSRFMFSVVVSILSLGEEAQPVVLVEIREALQVLF